MMELPFLAVQSKREQHCTAARRFGGNLPVFLGRRRQYPSTV